MSAAIAEPEVKVTENVASAPQVQGIATTPPIVAGSANVPAAAPSGSATDVKPAEVSTLAKLLADEKPTESAAAKPAEVPADAAWQLTVPEGMTVAAEDVKSVESFAKEHGLTKVQAEKVLGREAAARDVAQKAQQAQIDGVATAWLEEAKKHAEIGGDKLPGAIANAKKALMAWATPDERKLIAASPFANNPLFLAILNRAAASLPKEDVPLSDAGKAPTTQHPARILYGNR